MATAATKTITNDPAREALAAAITRHTDAKARATAAHAAKDGFWSLRCDAADAVEAATEAMHLAEGNAVDALAAGQPFLSHRELRAKLQDAEDRLAAIDRNDIRIKKAPGGGNLVGSESRLPYAQSLK